MKIDPARVIAIFVSMIATWSACTNVDAATIWINDWDTPAEQGNWDAQVTVIDQSHEDYLASRDLDGNGVYGEVAMGRGTTVWGPRVIEAPPGYKLKNIVLTWVWVPGHKPTGSSFTMDLSYLGVFQGEQRTASTAGAQGFQKLTLDTSDIPEFQGLSRVTVRLRATHQADWKLGASGLYMTADIVGPGQPEKVVENEKIASSPQPHHGGRSPVHVMLRWRPGTDSAAQDGHDVYLGTSHDEVSTATTSSKQYMGRHSEASFNSDEFAPEGLQMWQTYYWRVDEVNGDKLQKGHVWSFTADRGSKCVVAPGTELAVNGYSKIEPEIFSLTAYEGGTDFDPALNGHQWLDFCKTYGVEGIGFVFPPGWMSPPEPNHFWLDMTMDEVRQWIGDSGEAQRRFDAGPLPVVFGRILPALRAAGVSPFMYAYGPEPGTSGCKEGDCADRWIHVSIRCLGMWLKADPEFEYAHLWGEAAARWFRLDCGGHRCGPADYATFFNRWARAVHERYPQLKLGGPVTWGKPTTATGWEGWNKTLIDMSHEELDFLDWHAYGTPGVRLEGDLHASTAYARMNYGKWLRHAITETNNAQGDLKREEWYDYAIHYRKRVLYLADQTFRFLRNPDKTFNRQVHDYSAWAGTYTVKFKGHDALPVTPPMEMFRIFKPLRGRRVWTQNPFDDLFLEAAVEDDRLTIAMMNPSKRDRCVPLSITWAADNPVVGRSGHILTENGLDDLAVPATPDATPLQLPAESIVVAVYRTKNPIAVDDRVRRWEYFSEDLMVQINPNGLWQVSTTIRLNDQVRRNATSATLRFGINRDDEYVKPSWTIRIDGEPHTIEKATSFGELRLARVPSGNAVKLSFTCDAPPPIDYAVSFASIVLTGDADYGPPEPAADLPPRRLIWSNDFGTAEQQKKWADFAHDDPGHDLDGDGKSGFIQLPDTKSRHHWGVERIDAPPGKTMQDILVEWDVYRATANGADWQISLSPTGEFGGEQVVVTVPPGLGQVRLRLDVTGYGGFENLSSVYLRLAGSNGSIAWSSKASQIILSGTLVAK